MLGLGADAGGLLNSRAAVFQQPRLLPLQKSRTLSACGKRGRGGRSPAALASALWRRQVTQAVSRLFWAMPRSVV